MTREHRTFTVYPEEIVEASGALFDSVEFDLLMDEIEGISDVFPTYIEVETVAEGDDIELQRYGYIDDVVFVESFNNRKKSVWSLRPEDRD